MRQPEAEGFERRSLCNPLRYSVTYDCFGLQPIAESIASVSHAKRYKAL